MISVESFGGWPLLRLSGNLVQGSPSEAFTAAIQKLITSGQVNVICHIGEVEHMDSTGMGVLVAACAAAHRAGGRLVVCQPSKRVRAVLTTTHLMSLFEVADDEAAALEILQRPSASAVPSGAER